MGRVNVIEYTIDQLKNEVKRLEHDYKLSLKDPSYRPVYPYSKEGISHTLESIAHRAFELKVCNLCDKFHECNYMLLCIDAIEESAEIAKEYGDRCYNGLLERYRE